MCAVGDRVYVVFANEKRYHGRVTSRRRGRTAWLRVRFDDGEVYNVLESLCVTTASRPRKREVPIGPAHQATLPRYGERSKERGDRRLSHREVLRDCARSKPRNASD